MIDIAVPIDENGQFDIDIDPNTGDLLLVEGLETAIVMSLFCERRADPSEVPVAERRRGWWGNTVGPEGFEIGSKLWLLEQARKTQGTLNAATDYARKGLQWFIDDRLLKNIDVDTVATTTGANIIIKFNRSSSVTESRAYELWERTDLNNAI